MSNYIYISIETTGLEVNDERVIEIAALKIDSKTCLLYTSDAADE